ncbi:MAG: CHASE3 domain-containing protein [Cyanobacteria bacterium SBC]|nr:CHASE3 domain-containing protein [Cyanobacteria bacterium SBC]
MNAFKQTKIRNWIIAGYSVPVFLSALLSVFVARESHNLRMLIDNSQLVNDIALNIQIMSRTTRGYLLDRNDISKISYQNAKNTYNTDAATLAEQLVDPEQQQVLEALVKDVDDLIAINDSIFQFVESGKTDEAMIQWREDKGRKQVEDVQALLQSFRQEEDEILFTSLNTLLYSTLGFTLIVFLLSTSIGWWVVRNIANQMDQSAGAIASSSSEIAATVEQQERAATQQAASVNETTTTMDELGASSRQIMEQADAATENARQALNQADNGTRTVAETVETMTVLKDKVSAIARQILQLSEQTNQIGNISILVSDLANQTNMLALNAAVEAVRAGEHGKGFSVVASEIRKLADRSKKSAEKINALVADIQNAINSTVMVTDEGTKTVESGVRTSQNTSESFGEIRSAINEVVLNNQQISLTLKQQVSAVQQVVEAMNSLNTAARETASGISQVKVGTQRLNEAAISLKEMV